ncbi:hypothetical protein ACFVSW_19035 [Neobacillus sp. NPDC058068]
MYRLNKVYWEARDGTMQDINSMPLTGVRVEHQAAIIGGLS